MLKKKNLGSCLVKSSKSCLSFIKFKDDNQKQEKVKKKKAINKSSIDRYDNQESQRQRRASWNGKSYRKEKANRFEP